MTLRTKLLLSFLSLSTLIVVVGMIFYVQLKSLIEPLTPQSIPLSVEELSNSIGRNHLIHRISYQQLLVQSNLENYILTSNLLSLQNYYMNNEILYNLLNKSKSINILLSQELYTQYKILDPIRARILHLVHENRSADAIKLLNSPDYTIASTKMIEALNQYHQKFDAFTNEYAVVTIKLAIKNSTKILHDSLTTTLIIFFDAIIISLILVIISTRAISRPINLLRRDIDRMNYASLNAPINPKLLHIKGEIGDLARSFVTLVNKLRTTTVQQDELLAEVERRKKVETALRQSAYDLKESNRELDQFAYAASHDLRAPLRAIHNLAEWIEEDCQGNLPEKSQQHFNLLKKRALRLDGLISGILEYSRAGKLDTNPQVIDLNKLLHEIIENLSPPTRIKIDIKPHLPIISTNKVAITQVFQNLISNAINYNTQQNAVVEVGFEEAQYNYEFYVSDNGPGIDPQFHEKIFAIFQTLQSRDKIESTGIGLAIVKKIIDKMGGAIWLKSQLGSGTTFYFTWPK